MNRVLNYLGKFLSEFPGKPALLKERKEKKEFCRILNIKFEDNAFRKVVPKPIKTADCSLRREKQTKH